MVTLALVATGFGVPGRVVLVTTGTPSVTRVGAARVMPLVPLPL
jgi:hypothetical protein